jgi:hypothetical protein
MITAYIINFALTVIVKQEFNTGTADRYKAEKLSGINWKKAEEGFKKKKKI